MPFEFETELFQCSYNTELGTIKSKINKYENMELHLFDCSTVDMVMEELDGISR